MTKTLLFAFTPLKVLLAAGVIFSSAGTAAPVHLVNEAPVEVKEVAPGVILMDFGRVAFGNLWLTPPVGLEQEVTFHFGEALKDLRIDRKPPGSVRYAKSPVFLKGGVPLVVAPPPNRWNTRPSAAVLTPPEWGVVLPFRWVEIEGWPGRLAPRQIVRRSAFATTWNDDASSFRCSDPMLNRIWELCRYSIKATTFAGVYVDGDRERISYEADAYLNQLGHYASDHDVRMARDTYDRLMAHPTWPTEWASQMIFMAHADWMQTGDAAWLAARYEALKSKLLTSRARPDGLITSTREQIKKGDLVDWPAGERDKYVLGPVNTVVNAFHLRTLALMAELAKATGNETDAAAFQSLEKSTREAFQKTFYDESRGVYRDGEGIEHASQHASLFPLAFGLVPAAERARVTRFVAGRKMACSVYAAQYLLEGLFANGASGEAVALIGAPTDRSWRHMVESGTTITWEAWDQKYKPNQDWNHAWGAAPVNLLPRFVLGARPLTPGWGTALIQPNPGGLKSAEGKVPTPRGPLSIAWKNEATFKISLALPDGMKARVELPAVENSAGIVIDGKPAAAHRSGSRWIVEETVSGAATIEVR